MANTDEDYSKALIFVNKSALTFVFLSDDTVNSLRNRLHAMREIFGDSDEDDPRQKKVADRILNQRRKRKNCMDTIMDGSLMGIILAACLAMVLGAAFFAYKNLYFAVLKKIYPEHQEL